MKVFKFHAGEFYYVYAAPTQDAAQSELHDQFGEVEIVKSEEIPESEWDEKNIVMYEDNDITKDPFYVSIKEQIIGEDAQFICSNDPALID